MKVKILEGERLRDYFEVLKPRESSLLVFLGVTSGFVATGGYLKGPEFVLLFLALCAGVGGCNGLTNYLDRGIDVRLARTRNRALPAGRIRPAEKVLFWSGGLVVLGLLLALLLSPASFLAGALGVVAALLWRKSALSHLLLGGLSGISPPLVGWLAFRPPDRLLFSLCLPLFFWVQLHIWSILMAYREDYRAAGLDHFPLNLEPRASAGWLFFLGLAVALLSFLPGIVGGWSLFYFIAVAVLNVLLLGVVFYLRRNPGARSAYRLYRLSAFPYLGLLFLLMGMEVWLR